MKLTEKQKMQAYDVLIGEQLEMARRDKGLSQDDVAKLYHTSRQTISNYERGMRSINISNLMSLCDVCGFDAMKILTSVRYATDDEVLSAYSTYWERVTSLK